MPQQPSTYRVIETTLTGKGETVAYPDMAAPFGGATKLDSPNTDYIRWSRNYNVSASVEALLGVPVAAGVIETPHPSKANTWILRFPSTGGLVTFPLNDFIAAATGVLYAHVGGNDFEVSIDPVWEATFPSTEQRNAVFQPRAVMSLATSRAVAYPQWTKPRNGTQVVVLPDPPFVSAAPAPLAFAQGVAESFSVDLADYITVPAGAGTATWEILNSDDTALTFFTLDSQTGSVFNLTSPGAGFAVKLVKFKVTDVHGRTASLIATWDVVENFAIEVIGTPPPITAVRNATFSVPALIADYFLDRQNEAMTPGIENEDGTAAPAGYAWDGVAVTGPIEGVAVTRNLRLTATEQGPLGRKVRTEAFAALRPDALPIIVDVQGDVTVQEATTTRLVIDVRGILGTDFGETIQLANGDPLPSPRYAIQTDTPAAGQVTIDIDVLNNDIFTQAVRLFGKTGGAGGVDTWDNFNFHSRHNPPVAPAIIVDALNEASIVLDPVALSDDPAVNLLVAAEVSDGFATIVGGRLNVTPAPDAVTGTYVLEASAGGPQTTGTLEINWREYAYPEPSATFAPRSTRGTPFTAVDLAPVWRAGDAPIDPAGYEFVDPLTGERVGKTRVTAAGTFSISAAGFYSYVEAPGFIGGQPLVISAADENGRGSRINLEFTHTQAAASNDPAPPTDIPNQDDSRPLVGIGYSGYSDSYGERAAGSIHDASVSASTKWPTHSMAEAGDYDPQTGILKVPPNTTIQLRPLREGAGGYPTLYSGKWIIKYTAIPNTGAGGAANDVVLNVWSGPAPLFVDDGSAGDVVRMSFTVPNPSTTSYNPQIRSGPNGGHIIIHDICPEANEGEAFDATWKQYAGRYKVGRYMKTQGVINARQTRASDTIPDGWHLKQRNFAIWPTTLPAQNRNKIVAGMQRRLLIRNAKELQQAAWFCIPPFLGFTPVEDVVWACPTTVVTNAAGIKPEWVPVRDAMIANADAIKQQIDVEAFEEGRLWGLAALAEALPDNFALVFEPGNEIPNGKYAQANGLAHCWGRALGYTPSTPEAYALGWIAARQQRAFLAGLRSVKPNQWAYFALAYLKGASELEITKANAGYDAELSRGLGLNKLECAFGLTQYWWGEMKRQNGRNRNAGSGNLYGDLAPDATTFAHLWMADAIADQAAHFQNIENYCLDPATGRNGFGPTDTVYGVYEDMLYWSAKAFAWGFGYFLCYEGQDHNNYDNPGGLKETYGAAAAQVIWDYRKTVHAQNVMTRWLLLMTAFNPTNPAVTSGWRPQSFAMNFTDAAEVTATGGTAIAQFPWVCRLPNELLAPVDSGYALALEPFLRNAASLPAPLPDPDPTPDPPPPPDPAPNPSSGELWSEYFDVNDTNAKLVAAGWTGSSGALHSSWQVVAGDGKNVFRGTQTTQNARKAIPTRSAAQFEPVLNFEVRLASVSGQTATFFRIIEPARNIRFQLQNTGAEIEVTALYAPGTAGVPSAETVILTTSGAGDMTDGTFKTFRVQAYFNAANGYVRIFRETSPGVYAMIGDTGLMNTDPAGLSPILNTIELRYNRQVSHIRHFDNATLLP